MDRYDKDSGLVFRETITKMPTEQRPWEHRCVGVAPRLRAPRGKLPGLHAIAMRKIVCHAADLSVDALRQLPPTILEQIWREIRLHSLESFHVWKTFVMATDGAQSSVHRTKITSLSKPLVDFYTDLSCPTFIWLTSLSIDDVSYCCAGDLKMIFKISNLRHLVLRASSEGMKCPLSDSVVEYWAHRAQTTGAFGRLETLYIENTGNITFQVFNHLHNLPKLERFCAVETSIRGKNVANKQGWYSRKRSYFYNKTISEYHHHIQARPHDLFASYIERKQSRATKHNNGSSSLLQVDLRTRLTPGPNPHKAKHSWVYLFERNWNVSQQDLEKCHDSFQQRKKSPSKESATKKRKVKANKLISDDTFLTNMINDT